MMELIKLVIPPIMLLVGVALGGVLSHYSAVESSRIELTLQYQVERYTDLIIKMRQGFLEEREDYKKYRKMALAESNKLWLVASDEVIRAMNETFDKIDDNEASTDERNNSFREMVLTMREDLYGEETSLKADDIKLLILD